jgi:hypothetical protein
MYTFKRNWLSWTTLALAVSVTLVGCGGGGGDPGTSKFPSSTTPPITAAATVAAVTLDAVTTVENGGLGIVDITVTAIDSNRQVMAAVPVTFDGLDSTVTNLTPGAQVTNASGVYKTTFQVLGSKANRTLLITAKAGNVSTVRAIQIVGSVISGSSSNPELAVGRLETYNFTLKDSVGKALTNVPYEILDNTGAVVASGSTGATGGDFSYSFNAPNLPGQTVVYTARASGVSKTLGFPIQATQAEPAAVSLTGLSLNLQVNPISVPINRDGSESNQASVLATVKDNNGNPVRNARVLFKLAGPTVKEGRFTTGSVAGTAVSYTGTDGKAETSYIPGSTPTSTQALSVLACFGDTVAAAQACSPATTLSKDITVTGDPVSVFLGSDGLVGNDGAQNYVRNYVVQVVDSSGKAMSNVRVAADLNTVDYRKGSYSRVGSKWLTDYSDGVGLPVTSHYLICPKEDLDDDDQLDAVEDLNHSGRLEPRRAAVALSYTDNGNAAGTQFTNANGLVFLRLSYPKNVATWINVELTATAIVNNSEGRDSTREVLRALIDDINAEGSPAFVLSPFGTVTTNQPWGAATFPDGSAAPGGNIAPCNNPDFLR